MRALIGKYIVPGLIMTMLLQVNGVAGTVNKNYQINGSFEYATNPDIPA